MKNRQSGFTVLELIIVMAIFMLVIISASQMFVSLLTEFKQQGKIAITNIEGILGLEMMRRDIEHAGYGLPWDGITAYSEISAGANAVAAALKDALITEDQPLRPVPAFPYGSDKAEVDQMFQEYAKTHPKQSVTIVRVVAVTGPNAGPSGLNVLFLPVTMYVRGCDPEWQFIFEDDLAKLDVFLVKERKSGVFNAGADGSVRYREMLGFTGKPSLGLPAWLWKPLISIGWKLHIQRKSQAGGLEFMKYPILVSTEKLAKTTNFTFTMNSREP